MKPEGSRIGNLFQEEKTKQIIKVIELTETKITFTGKFQNEWQAEPIPLNEEWLLKLGAIPFRSDYVYGRFRLIWKETYSYWYVVDRHNLTYLTKTKTVDHWQNFVYAMNQKELTIKTETV